MYIQGTPVKRASRVKLILETKLNHKQLGQESIANEKKQLRFRSLCIQTAHVRKWEKPFNQLPV